MADCFGLHLEILPSKWRLWFSLWEEVMINLLVYRDQISTTSLKSGIVWDIIYFWFPVAFCWIYYSIITNIWRVQCTLPPWVSYKTMYFSLYQVSITGWNIATNGRIIRDSFRSKQSCVYHWDITVMMNCVTCYDFNSLGLNLEVVTPI